MSITLSITDNQNGSGATAVVSGATSDSPVTVYAVSVPRLQALFWEGVLAWETVATRMGSGPLQLPLRTVGYYWAYAAGVVSGSPAVSPPRYFQVSSYVLPVYEQIRRAVFAKIQGLDLPSLTPPLPRIEANRVYLQSMMQEYTITYPCIIIAEEDEQETVEAATNWRDDITYPVRVFILNRDSEFDSYLPTYLLWRQILMASFREQRLPNVQEVWTCKVQPLLVIDEAAQRLYQHVVSGMVFRFVAREARGTGGAVSA